MKKISTDEKFNLTRLIALNAILKDLVPEIRLEVFLHFKSYALDEEYLHDIIEKTKISQVEAGIIKSSSEIKKLPKKGKIKKTGNNYQVLSLIDEGFFDTPQILSQVKEELVLRGFHITLANIGKPLQRLCQQKKLRRVKASNGVFSYSKL